MPSIAPSKSTTCVARVPYLNSAPFFRGLTLGEGYELADFVPRALGRQAAAGGLTAGLLPIADYFRLESAFERLGPFGIAVRGRARSVTLFSRKPIRQLDGATIAISEETSTTAILLRLLLEQRYHLAPAAYERGQRPDADALLLIGDDALRFQHANTRYPYETDVAFEWWLWQHLPFVFAVWAVRKDAGAQERKQIETALSRTLALNSKALAAIAADASPGLGIPAESLKSYLANFIYRLSRPEEEGIAQFKALVETHHLL